MNEVVFKGSRSGLKMILTNTIDFATNENLIRQKLDASFKFFEKGTVIHLDADWLSELQKEKLEKLFDEYGLILQNAENDDSAENHATADNANSDAADNGMKMPLKTTVINQTIRNGQEVISDGSVVINGNVNPGATVIAAGNIDIHGACRGIVHAGAFGNIKATVSASYLIPMQIRIADMVARAPDKCMSKEDAPYPEKAYVSDGQIILEQLTGRR